jgi:hypothetical protein
LHSLQTGFSLKMPMVCRCFLGLQWPVISPVTTLICVLLNCRTSAASDGMVCPSLACSVCDLPCWSNVSGGVILCTQKWTYGLWLRWFQILVQAQ